MRYARSEYPTSDITSQAYLSPTRKSRQAPSASSPQPARAEECSPPPRHLNAYAKEEWQHIAPELHRLNLLTVLDVGPLATYCCAAAQLRQAQGAIERMSKQDRRSHALTIEATRAIKSRIHCCVSRRQWPTCSASARHSGLRQTDNSVFPGSGRRLRRRSSMGCSVSAATHRAIRTSTAGYTGHELQKRTSTGRQAR
jgi:phage terminase small subunit